jgi:hypothetical protein
MTRSQENLLFFEAELVAARKIDALHKSRGRNL